MNYSSYFLGEHLYSIGRVVVDSSLHTQSADERFFTYFGNSVTYSIRRTFLEDDLPRISECMEDLRSGEVRRTVVRMTGLNGYLRWMLASVRIQDNNNGETFYSISFSDIFSLEALAYGREKHLSDYRYFLSLINDLGFEYCFETKKIRIFMFDCCREIVLIDEELEKWRNSSISSGYVLTRYIETFNSLCRDIKNGVYRFDYELETSVLTGGKARELCLFHGITRFDDPGSFLL